MSRLNLKHYTWKKPRIGNWVMFVKLCSVSILQSVAIKKRKRSKDKNRETVRAIVP